MRILGIDPGVAIVGFGVLDVSRTDMKMAQYGAITTNANTALATRLFQIQSDLEILIHDYKPDVISIEELFFSKNITTGIAVAHARGIILFTSEKMGIPIYEYTPMQVKQCVTGYGLAEKRQVMEMVKRLLKLKNIPKPDDAADALAIAITHARSISSQLFIKDSSVKETI